MKNTFKAVLALCTFAFASASFAAPVFYTSEASFNTDAGALPIIDLTTPGQSGTSLTFPGLTVGVPDVGSNFLFYGSNGVESSNNGVLFDFNFGSAITAFGGIIRDLGTVGATTLSMEIFSGAASLGSQALYSGYTAGSGGSVFGGVIDLASFDRIVISNTSAGDYVEFTEVRADVPAPATLALLGLGLLGLGAARRRS